MLSSQPTAFVCDSRSEIATRIDPPLSLARLRARGQMTELRAADLRFTSAEAAQFLSQTMDLDLSAADVAALESSTEGWIAGLQLAAISLQGHENAADFIKSFAGTNRLVLDFLVEEVLKRQPEYIQLFLLGTAILGRMTGSLCNALTLAEAAGFMRIFVDEGSSMAGLLYEVATHAISTENLVSTTGRKR